MAFGDMHAHIIVTARQAGQTCAAHLHYYNDTPDINASPLLLATAFVADCWTALWKAAVSPQFILEQVECYINQNPSAWNKPSAFVVVGENGQDLSGDVLPPNVTVGGRKMVDNLTKTPPTALDFRNGSLRFSGVPEADQNDGLLTASALTKWGNVMGAFKIVSVDFGGGAIPFQLGLFRWADPIAETGAEKVSVVNTTVSSKLGTQNSRKR